MFHAYACFQTSHHEELLHLRSTVISLQEEIVQLRSDLNQMSNTVKNVEKVSASSNRETVLRDQWLGIGHSTGGRVWGQTRHGRGSVPIRASIEVIDQPS